MPKLTAKDERVINLAFKGGRDAELYLLHELENEIERIEKKIEELKAAIPDLDTVLASVRGAPGPEGKAGRNAITVSHNPPNNPQIGDLWYQP